MYWSHRRERGKEKELIKLIIEDLPLLKVFCGWNQIYLWSIVKSFHECHYRLCFNNYYIYPDFAPESIHEFYVSCLENRTFKFKHKNMNIQFDRNERAINQLIKLIKVFFKLNVKIKNKRRRTLSKASKSIIST